MAPSRVSNGDSDASSGGDVVMNDVSGPVARVKHNNGDFLMRDALDTPDYTDSDTNPNTTASSVAGDVQHADGRKRRSEAFQLRKSVFGKKHSRLNESKEDDMIRRFKHLLGMTDLFRHFIGSSPNPRVQQAMAEIDRQNKEEEATGKKGLSRKGGAAGGHRRRTEQEEDAELMREEKHGGATAENFFWESPAYIKGGQMREYQVQGLNWLIDLHENGLSGILADEMGLGKTLQTIAFLGYLRYFKGINGPHLIAVPKSTLDNWHREFSKWIPDFDVLILQGAKDERQELIQDRLIDEKFDVCITSYEMILREKSHLKKFAWEYMIVDEAHRIKNEESTLAQIIRLFNSRQRLLITGTPLQNNLHELWALLNFLMPDIFGDSKAFDKWFQTREEDEATVVKQLHKILRPFLLRRVKSDVEKSLLPKKEVNLYIGMSEMQVMWYRKILSKDIDAVNGAGDKSKTRLLNIVMQLRKCSNHPYLFEGAEPGPPYTTDEHLVDNASKMLMLDKLLKRFQARGSRVLIFSQMSRMLDILEDYSVMRGFQYCRIDGSTAHEDRIAAIDEYNKDGSEKFLFLLTTRAGGLGINLTTADIVILFDSDWNPQADLQAMDRAHRIGQTKQVYVYRFVTENAIEEKVLERAAQKLRLDQLVIQQGRAQLQANKTASRDELLSMIQHGATNVLSTVFEKSAASFGTQAVTDDDIDAILKRGEERTAELNSKYEKLGIDDLQNFKSESYSEWNGLSFVPAKKDIALTWINPTKRERKEQSYSMDVYYRKTLQTGGRTAEARQRIPRAPKQVQIHDYQFFPPGLAELQDKETAYYRKENNIKAPLAEGTDEDLQDRLADQELAQKEIDNAEPLTEAEKEAKERLIQQGFPEWNKRDFQQFINGSAKFGRTNWQGIATEVDGKDVEQIKEYAKVFWKKYKTLDNWEKALAVIEDGEARTERIQHQRRMLRKKLSMYRVPLQQMKINYSVSTTNKKVYTEDEDRFLLISLDKHGVDTEGIYEKIRDDIRDSPLFAFDWFFLSRTPVEISRRCTTLLTAVAREFEDGNAKVNGSKRKNGFIDDEDEEELEEQPPKKKKGLQPKVSNSDISERTTLTVSSAGTAKTAKATTEKVKLTKKQNKALDTVKGATKSRSSVASSTRSPSVLSDAPKASKGKSAAKSRKK